MIGEKGKMLKKVGLGSERNSEKFFGKKFFLETFFVKVEARLEKK